MVTKMIGNKMKKVKSNIYFQYTVLFCVMAFITFFWFIAYGKTFIHYQDGYWQHYSFLVFTKRVITSFLAGEGFSFWSWSLGLGNDVIGNMAGVLCDPFNYIALLIPDAYLDVAFSVAIILRMFAAGLSMIAFLKYMKKSQMCCLIGALGYAFSSWALGVLRHGFFLTPLFIFPLLILGIEKIDREKKPLVFIFSVVFSLITSVYFSYMSALMVILYMVLKFFFDFEDKNAKLFWKRFGNYVFYVVIAVCIAAPIFIPIFYGLLNVSKDSGIKIELLPTLYDLLRYVPSYIANTDINYNYSFVMVPMFFMALLPAMIISRKKKTNRLSFFFVVLCAVMTLFPLFGSILNGFSYSAGRWCYIMAFFMVYGAVSSYEYMDFKDVDYRDKYLKIMVMELILLLVGVLVAKVIVNVIGTDGAIIALLNLVFIGIFVAIFLIADLQNWEQRKKKIVLVSLFVVNTSLTHFIQFSPNMSATLDAYMDVGIPYERYMSSPQEVATQIKDKDFYRVDQMEGATVTGRSIDIRIPSNENLFFGTRNIYFCLSTIDSKHYEINKSLLNSAGYSRRSCLYSNDNRSRLDFLEGVKYFLGDNKEYNVRSSQYAGYAFEKYKRRDGVQIMKSDHEPSLGYVYDTVISREEYDKYEPLDREQLLMQAVVLENVENSGIAVSTTNALTTHTRELNYEVIDDSGVMADDNNTFAITTSMQGVKLELKESVEDCELYVKFENLQRIPPSYDDKISQLKNDALEYDNSIKLRTGRFAASNMSYAPYGDFYVYVKKDNIKKNIINAEGVPQAFTDMNDYMVNMGYYKVADGMLDIVFSAVGTYTYDAIKIYAVSQEDFDDQAQKLSNNRYNVEKLYDNYISGTVNAQSDGVLYLSILYNPGWKIYIDGKESETFITNVGFTGTNIKKGTHKVELKYRPVLFDLSIVLFIVGVLTVASMHILPKMKREKSNEEIE